MAGRELEVKKTPETTTGAWFRPGELVLNIRFCKKAASTCADSSCWCGQLLTLSH